MNFDIPETLKREHIELHAELKSATRAGGKTGEAAVKVAELMHPHFIKEEEYALPPLALLESLASGRFEQGMAEVLAMTDKLAKELPTMLEEHRAIVTALEKLTFAAREELKSDVEGFAERLIAHAKMEEQVSYPAALLVGEFVKLKL